MRTMTLRMVSRDVLGGAARTVILSTMAVGASACSGAIPDDSASQRAESTGAAAEGDDEFLRFPEDDFEDHDAPLPLTERVVVTAHLIQRDAFQWTVRFTATNRGSEPVRWGAPGEMPIRVYGNTWSEEDQGYGYRVSSLNPAPTLRLGTLEPGESRSWTVNESRSQVRNGVGLLFHDAREGRDVIVWANWLPILLGRAPGSARLLRAR